MSMRIRRFLISGAAATCVAFCGVSAQAYDAEFDYNSDGSVDAADVAMITAAMNSAEGDEAFDPMFDHDWDGFVGGTDVVLAQEAANAE